MIAAMTKDSGNLGSRGGECGLNGSIADRKGTS